MMMTAVVGLLLAAEPSINELVDGERETACAGALATSKRCAMLKAFREAKPASGKPFFAIGTWEEEGATGYAFIHIDARGVAAGSLEPDDAAEGEKFEAIVTGKAKKKDPLFDAVAKDVAKQPHVAAMTGDGSLLFQVNRPLGGNWLRAAGGKLYLVQFSGNLHDPKVRVCEFAEKR